MRAYLIGNETFVTLWCLFNMADIMKIPRKTQLMFWYCIRSLPRRGIYISRYTWELSRLDPSALRSSKFVIPQILKIKHFVYRFSLTLNLRMLLMWLWTTTFVNISDFVDLTLLSWLCSRKRKILTRRLGKQGTLWTLLAS